METVEVPLSQKETIEVSCKAIDDKHLLKFVFKNQKNVTGERTIRPYMIIPRGKILELVGTLVEELSMQINGRQARHFDIKQLSERITKGEFEVLPDTFDDPGVPRKIVVITKGTPVCRFIYPDEDAKAVKSHWLKVKYT